VTDIVRVTVLPVLLIILATTFSIPLAEAGSISPALIIFKEDPGQVEMEDNSGSILTKDLNDDDIVQICNNLDFENAELTVRDENGVAVFGPFVMSQGGSCVELTVGTSQLPGGGTKYKVSGGSPISIDACSVGQGPTVFSLGICPEVEGQVIGGRLIPIDTTSLLVAGVQTNYSILIALLIVGAGFVVFKLKRK